MTLFVPYDGERIEIKGPRRIAIAAQDVERTARFYARLFGFRVAADRRDRGEGDVLLSARDKVFITLREARGGSPAAGQSLALAVEDLDRARETLWNQGVVPAGGSMAPRGPHDPERFLTIRDPDGREIELVEDVMDGSERLAFVIARAVVCA